MKSATTDLIEFLASANQMCMADVFDMETLSGVSRYTGADVDLFVEGNNYSSSGPLIKRDSTRLVRGIEVDSMKLKIAASQTMLIEGLPFVQAARMGALDNARIVLRKVFMEDWTLPIKGSVILFAGRVSDVSGSRSQCEIEVKSDLELLTVELPRNRYQAACVHTVYGPGCGVQRGSFQVTGAISGGSTRAMINTALVQADGYFNQGVFEFTSGPNVGFKRTVKKYAPGVFTFALPLPYTPTTGETFKVVPGCDKTQATCLSKFNNLGRRKGYNYVPASETVY